MVYFSTTIDEQGKETRNVDYIMIKEIIIVYAYKKKLCHLQGRGYYEALYESLKIIVSFYTQKCVYGKGKFYNVFKNQCNLVYPANNRSL